MPRLQKICKYLDGFAPFELAESWDNTGLLIGDPAQHVERAMTCLTVTPESVAEAIEAKTDLIVSHHPMMFRPINRLTTDTVAGKMILELIKNNVALYSPHTAFDSTTNGINELIASKLNVESAVPLKPLSADQLDLGSGRIGNLAHPCPVDEFANRIKQQFQIKYVGVVDAGVNKDDSESGNLISKVAIGCGSGGSFLNDSAKQGANALVTGEATFHTCLDARAQGVALFLLGHFASERFAIEALATRLKGEFDNVEVWPSRRETDPIRFL